MVKDKDYYTKPIFQDSFYTQCLWDLAGGEIKIYDIPFEYREGVAYVLARKALRYEVFGENTQHEKTLLMECLKNDNSPAKLDSLPDTDGDFNFLHASIGAKLKCYQGGNYSPPSFDDIIKCEKEKKDPSEQFTQGDKYI